MDGHRVTTDLTHISQEVKEMKKRFLKSKPVCKVMFELPSQAVNGAAMVTLVGDFNGWDPATTPMKRHKDGTWSVMLDLPRDREYQFRYLIDGERWENDWQVDKYVPNSTGECENSVVVT
jgi:1,4-alpha-glucan branching enzyme